MQQADVTSRMSGRMKDAQVTHPVALIYGLDQAPSDRDFGSVLAARPNHCSGCPTFGLRKAADVVEMVVGEHDVGDIRPLRSDSHQGLADLFTAAGCTGIDEHDSTWTRDYEAADLKAHRIRPEHPRGDQHPSHHRFDRYFHVPTIADDAGWVV